MYLKRWILLLACYFTILQNFDFNNQLTKMTDAGILGSVIEKFTSSELNLSPYDVKNSNGEIIKRGLDNHAMGTLFEEIIRKFNEENNEEAGEHFTPRDVIELMADITMFPIMDKIKDGTYSIYDGHVEHLAWEQWLKKDLKLMIKKFLSI
ncbi:N-6 DNA methylase [Clostridioides difficile]|uniref:N-6 DNA methylase n=1 Tax=Clostridioides difficile TaxID=1496 RepID=UPI00097FD416|nr:N-6 DNA methylase [Clostridioides difficile]MDC0804336.1 N-6 DNA methylase [Clostridium paraputrificum]MCM3858899.1 N-6 DNA methylase [Clostridioides difficile]MCV2268279.1 N-6 DNA methylase [Clostridioides difficile]MCX4224703.1 N-6 DNA methylase [Clostridioides difficile]MDS6276917.1 N-6 DNA methylase [Clostridioides difficile]